MNEGNPPTLQKFIPRCSAPLWLWRQTLLCRHVGDRNLTMMSLYYFKLSLPFKKIKSNQIVGMMRKCYYAFRIPDEMDIRCVYSYSENNMEFLNLNKEVSPKFNLG